MTNIKDRIEQQIQSVLHLDSNQRPVLPSRLLIAALEIPTRNRWEGGRGITERGVGVEQLLNFPWSIRPDRYCEGWTLADCPDRDPPHSAWGRWEAVVLAAWI